MQELRFVAVSEDGRYAVLAIPGRSARFTLPIDERLRAVAQGQTSRLAQYEIEVESPLRPKEIQARIRAGETVEEIADAAGIAIERVRWFEGPVLAERAYVAEQAQAASVRRQGDATPGPRLGEIVTERLNALHADPEEAQWDAKKRGDGSWQVELTFISGGRVHTAEWLYDQRRRHVLPADDNAARMSLPGAELPQPAEPNPGEATVTQLAPRLSSAVGNGSPGYAPGHAGSSPGYPAPGNPGPGYPGPGYPSSGGNGNGGRSRHERPAAAAARPAAPEAVHPVSSSPASPGPAPSGPASPAPEPRTGRHSYSATERPAAPERPAAQAPGSSQAKPPAAPPATPASVAAQVSKVAQASGPARDTQANRAPAPTAEPAGTPELPQAPRPVRAQQPDRPERVNPARHDDFARRENPRRHEDSGRREEPARPAQAPAAAAPAPQAAAKQVPAPAEPAPEPATEQTNRPSRKAARGKRSSVPSWDEIMFGNRRD
jgi:hypothetical protein